MAVAAVVATVLALRLDAAIPAALEADVATLFNVALLLPVMMCSLLVAIGSVFSAEISEWVGVPADQLWCVAIVALLQCLVSVCQARLLRQGEFDRGAALRIAQPLSFLIVAVMFQSSLILALVAGWIISTILALVVTRVRFSVNTWVRSTEVIRGAWKYPLISTPTALLDTLSLTLPLLFIINSFGNEVAGNYAQMQRVVGAPLLLVGVVTGQVFFKHAGDLYRAGGEVTPFLKRVVMLLGLFGAGLMGVIWLLGAPIMHLLLGEGWRTDTMFIALVAAPVVIRIMVSPVSSVFLITNRVGKGGYWQIGYFVISVGFMYFAWERMSLEEFLAGYVLCELLSYGCYLGLAIAVARSSLLVSRST